MRVSPPANLVSLLERLKLATADEVAAVAPRAVRLAGNLPDFESVWVDALSQARVLTPYQAAEINQGRGPALQHGPYVILRQLPAPHYAECYAARSTNSGQLVRLYVVRSQQTPLANVVSKLAELTARSGRGNSSHVLLNDFGTGDQMVWATCAHVEATTAAAWMVENGRLPPQAVLEIARQLAVRLRSLTALGITHGDVGAAGLLLTTTGDALLPAPGLRGIVRPHEGYSFGDLRPEGYDYLAPERVAEGTSPTVATDIYACGCLWWHLLTGRAPLPGGDSLAKLKSAHAARVGDVRQLAPTVGERLAATIARCVSRDIHARPASFAELVELLGPATAAGAALVARMTRDPAPTWQISHRARRPKSQPRKLPQWAVGAFAATALCGVAIAPVVLNRHTEPAPVVSVAGATAGQTAELQSTVAIAASAKTPVHAESALQESLVDRNVKPASAVVPAETTEPIVEDIVLPAGEVLNIEQLDLVPHVRVRGPAGKRPLVRLSSRGLLVDCEDVSFEGIDFIGTNSGDAAQDNARLPAMFALRAQTATFRRCSLAFTGNRPPAAIGFFGSTDNLPGLEGEIVLQDCVFDGLAAVIDHRAPGGLAVQVSNSLCVAAGPIVRMERWPSGADGVKLVLDRVTTRGDTSVMECLRGNSAQPPGAVSIIANESALATGSRGGLVIFSGPDRPDQLARSLDWTGQGSILTPQTAMVIWRPPGRKPQSLQEDELQVAGLVRSELEFSGPSDGPPETSRVLRWQVPLRSPDAPGADPTALSRPLGGRPAGRTATEAIARPRN